MMLLEGKAVLDVVDTATIFSATTFFDALEMSFGQSSNGVWLAFVMTSSIVYSGYPNIQGTNQGSSFTSNRWKQLADTNSVQIQLSEIESHCFLVYSGTSCATDMGKNSQMWYFILFVGEKFFSSLLLDILQVKNIYQIGLWEWSDRPCRRLRYVIYAQVSSWENSRNAHTIKIDKR